MGGAFGLDFFGVGSVTGIMHSNDALDAETLDAVNALFAEVTASAEDAAEIAASGQRASLTRSEAAEIAQALGTKCQSMVGLMDAVNEAIGEEDKKTLDTEH